MCSLFSTAMLSVCYHGSYCDGTIGTWCYPQAQRLKGRATKISTPRRSCWRAASTRYGISVRVEEVYSHFWKTKVRSDYTKKIKQDSDLAERQLGVAMWVIDVLALRVGGVRMIVATFVTGWYVTTIPCALFFNVYRRREKTRRTPWAAARSELSISLSIRKSQSAL